jgi:hypothetical protein
VSLVKCLSHIFGDRQGCNNSAAYLFLPQQGSIFTPSGFGGDCHPPQNRELKAPAYARSGIRQYWILDINADRLYVFPEPGAECYGSPVVLAKSDLIAPLAFPDCQESVEDLLSTPAEPSCQ